MGCEFHRMNIGSDMSKMPVLDTCTEVTASLLKLPGGRGGRFKLPTLTELHSYLFNVPFSEAHNATADVEATTRCFLELVRRDIFTKEQTQNFRNNLNTNNIIEIDEVPQPGNGNTQQSSNRSSCKNKSSVKIKKKNNC